MSNHVYRRTGSPHWHFSVTVPGRGRIRKSSGTDVKKDAEKLAAKIEAQEWKRHTDGDENTFTFAEAVIVYVADGKPNDYLGPLNAHFKARTVKSIRPGDIQAAARILYPGLSPATQNRQAIVPARAVINHAADRGLCPHIRVKLFRETPPARRAVDDPWLRRFRAHAPLKYAALVSLMATTGARIGQAIEIHWDEVNLQQGEVMIPPAKGYPERIGYLTPELVADLANLRAAKPLRKRQKGHGLVFGLTSRSSVYRPWRAICEAAGIDYLPTHQSGRHTFFTTMIVRNGIDPKTAAELGGSASPSLLLKTYVHPENPREVIHKVFGTKRPQGRSARPRKMLKNKAL